MNEMSFSGKYVYIGVSFRNHYVYFFSRRSYFVLQRCIYYFPQRSLRYAPLVFTSAPRVLYRSTKGVFPNSLRQRKLLQEAGPVFSEQQPCACAVLCRHRRKLVRMRSDDKVTKTDRAHAQFCPDIEGNPCACAVSKRQRKPRNSADYSRLGSR